MEFAFIFTWFIWNRLLWFSGISFIIPVTLSNPKSSMIVRIPIKLESDEEKAYKHISQRKKMTMRGTVLLEKEDYEQQIKTKLLS